MSGPLKISLYSHYRVACGLVGAGGGGGGGGVEKPSSTHHSRSEEGSIRPPGEREYEGRVAAAIMKRRFSSTLKIVRDERRRASVRAARPRRSN